MLINQLPLSQQIKILMQVLETTPKEKVVPELKEKVVAWIGDIPPASRPLELAGLLVKVFGMLEKEAKELVTGEVRRRTDKPEFEPLVPATGWLRDYVEYTRNTEPPTVFHFFTALTALGATLGRSVYFAKAYTVFPNLCTILIAPSGKCRKTSACNFAVDLFRATEGIVLADKTTPEALVEAFKERASAVGLIYAPELAVFLGKQKYQEGMIPMLTSLFDAPREWSSATIMRGEAKLSNVAISMLGASTIDWMQSAIPRDAFGGGFMSRLIFIVQENTPRSFAIPPPLNEDTKARLIRFLLRAKNVRGEFKLSQTAEDWYKDWYDNKKFASDDKHFAGYIERKPDHLLRIAMGLSVSADPGTLILSLEICQQAERILQWIEQWLPAAFEDLSITASGEDAKRILNQLRNTGGSMEHSKLLRRNYLRLNADAFRKIMDTLIAVKEVEYDAKARKYFLTPSGWGV